MKTKSIISAVVLAAVYFGTRQHAPQHSLRATAFTAIALVLFFILWNPPPKHKEFGPEDEDEVLRTPDGSHH